MDLRLSRLKAIITDMNNFTPNNLQEEKKKFFKNKKYNPIFSYDELDFPLDQYRTTLESYLQSPQHKDTVFSNLVQETARELILSCELLKCRGQKNFFEKSREVYGFPNTKTIQEAKKILEKRVVINDKKLTANEILPSLQEALASIGVDWKIELSDSMVARAQVIAGKKLFRLNSKELFSELDVKKLIVHEIKTHALRAKNGSLQACEVFQTGTAHYLETEEGLATWAEEQAGCLSDAWLRILALRVVAVNLAKEYSFSYIFKQMCNYVDEQTAFTITLRVKRGLGRTDQEGCLTKDHLYLSGFLKVKSLPIDDIKYLYTGKISVNHLPLIKKLVEEKKVTLFDIPSW